MEKIIKIHLEKLPEGPYLATSDDIQGLVAQGRTASETIEIARDVSRKLIEEQGGIAMKHTAVKDYVKIPKQEYNLLKEVYQTVKRQAFLVRLDEAERNLSAGKTKTSSVDDFIEAV